MAQASNAPKIYTVQGLLSFPNFSYQGALKKDATSKFPKADKATVKPDFNVLLTQVQLDAYIAFLTGEFLPYCLDQFTTGGDKARDALSKKDIDILMKAIDAADWATQPPYIPIKAVNDKTKDLSPASVASIKVVGNPGSDIEQRAVVQKETELLVPDPDIIQWPAVVAANNSVFNLYAGCTVAVTCNHYAYHSGALPGFTAAGTIVVFKADGTPFSGGVAMDEAAIFADN